MIAYRATLDVPRELVQFVRSCCWRSAGGGAPPRSRALTCFWQAVLGLRWFRDRTAPAKGGSGWEGKEAAMPPDAPLRASLIRVPAQAAG